MAIAVCLAVAGWGPDPAQADTYFLNPTDDSYVSSISPTANFANDPLNIYTDGYNQYSYLKFDLTGIPDTLTVTGATLHLNMYFHSINGAGALGQLHQVTDNSWSESTITWNNQPGFSATVWDSVSFTSGMSNGWVVWTVPNSGVDLTQDDLSLLLKFNDLAFITWAAFRADEYGTGEVPYLEIQGVPIPLPGAVWLLGTGLLGLGLGGYARRRRS